mgnify:CR=1 FL=1
MVDKFKKKIQEQAKEKQSEAGKEFGNGKNSSSPNGEKLNIHTDKELAKMAGVGTGTIARYNRVMNSDVLMDRFVQMLSNGEIGESAKKVGKRIKELERIYGIEHGGDRKTSNPKVSDLNQSDIAEMIGISVDTLNNYKKLTELIPELEDLVDTGIVTKLYRIVTKKYIYLFEQYICDTLKSCMRRFGR